MRSGDLDPEYEPAGPLRAPSRHWRRLATPLQRLVQAWMRAFGASHLLSDRREDCSTGGASKARVAAIYPDSAGIGIAKDIRHAALPAGRQGGSRRSRSARRRASCSGWPTGWKRIRSARSRRSRPESAGSRPARFWSGAASRPGWRGRTGASRTCRTASGCSSRRASGF